MLKVNGKGVFLGLIAGEHYITIGICPRCFPLSHFVHHKLRHAFSIVNIKLWNGNLETPVAHQRQKGGIVPAERTFTGNAAAKDLDFVPRVFLESLEYQD